MDFTQSSPRVSRQSPAALYRGTCSSLRPCSQRRTHALGCRQFLTHLWSGGHVLHTGRCHLHAHLHGWLPLSQFKLPIGLGNCTARCPKCEAARLAVIALIRTSQLLPLRHIQARWAARRPRAAIDGGQKDAHCKAQKLFPFSSRANY